MWLWLFVRVRLLLWPFSAASARAWNQCHERWLVRGITLPQRGAARGPIRESAGVDWAGHMTRGGVRDVTRLQPAVHDDTRLTSISAHHLRAIVVCTKMQQGIMRSAAPMRACLLYLLACDDARDWTNIDGVRSMGWCTGAVCWVPIHASVPCASGPSLVSVRKTLRVQHLWPRLRVASMHAAAATAAQPRSCQCGGNFLMPMHSMIAFAANQHWRMQASRSEHAQAMQ